MNQAQTIHLGFGQQRRALTLVLLMTLMSCAPMLSLPLVSAHADPSGVTWPLQGSNDTGWVRLNAIGADATTGQQASADWDLMFPPGAVLSNVSLEVRASGQNGLTMEDPFLAVNGMGTSLFDWRGLGVLGQAGGFASGSTYSGRLNPNSNSGAGWDIPSSSEITEMVIQVLAPSDAMVSLNPVQFEIQASIMDENSGLMYVATDEQLLILNAKNSPPIIDVYDFSAQNGVLDLQIDTSASVLHILFGDGSFQAISLLNSSPQSTLGSGDFEQFLITSSGDIFAANGLGLYGWNGGAWTSLIAVTTSDSPTSALAMAEVSGIVYASIAEAGIVRFNTANNQALSTWSTANSLHSDNVNIITTSGSQLLLGSLDNGVGRYDFSAGFWLSTWNAANWLDSNIISGLVRVSNTLYILDGTSLHTYNSTNGVFSTTYDLSDFNLAGTGSNLMVWTAVGAGAPDTDSILVDDGSGTLARLTPDTTPIYDGEILLASGPNTGDATGVVELNGILYIGSGDGSGISRYNVNSAVWLSPWSVGGDNVVKLATDGTSLFVALENSPVVEKFDVSTGMSTRYDGTNGCYPASSKIQSIAVDAQHLALSIDTGTFAVFDLLSSSCTSYDTTNGLPTSLLGDVALWGGMAFVATENRGVLRYDIANDTWLEAWGSTGINGVNEAPVAVVGNILYLGLPGYGVARKDLSTGEILSPLTSANQGGTLPSNQIYALESDGTNLYIGTQQGARRWNGNQMTSFGLGTTWQTRPQQFFDFEIDGTDLYAGTNIGICKYTVSTLAMNDCQNQQDGMPNWAVYSVGVDSTYVYGGTTSGVGLVTKSNFQHHSNWGQGTQTGNAVVVVLGDIAYIGTEGLGVLRYNITTNHWLTPFDEASGVLDGGNDDVTGLVADIRPNQLWVGGGDGFQLLNVTTGTEVYDIELTGALYTAADVPYDLVIHNDIMYYHAGTASDEVSRLDVQNFSALSNLDIGARVGENNGDIVDLKLAGDEIVVSIVSGQWWNVDGSGGIARWNTTTSSFATNILPTGSIERVTAYESSNGNTWVAWGELKLDLYDSNRTLVNSWTSFDLPIRGIVEYNGETLFASEAGILRYNEATNQWNSTWTAGNGLPNNAGSQFYELWADANNLVVGGARFNNFGNFVEGIISHRNPAGAWTAYPADSYTNIPDGYPISMTMCGGLLNVAMYNGNGGIARIDLANYSVQSDFDQSVLDGFAPASVVCDTQGTLYIGYYNDNQPISRYSYATQNFLSSLTSSSHNLPSDRVWYDGLAHSGTQLIIGHGIGQSGSNIIGGGYSTMVANGATAVQAQVYSGGSSVTSFQWLSASSQWLLGQAGGSSGYSHVSTLSTTGLQKVVDLPGLVSGQVTAMYANSTHIWVTTGGGQFGAVGNGGSTGTGVLQGIFLPNGTVEWEYGWTLPGNTIATDLYLQGNELFIASNPGGMLRLNLRTRSLTQLSGAIHNKFDTMALYNNQLVIGLAGAGGSPPGVQMFNPLTSSFGNGRLIAGLPSNIINGFTSTNSILYISTNGGVGRWNYSTNDWMDSITRANGLPNDFVEQLKSIGTDVYMATPSGVFIWDEVAGSGTTLGSSNGLMGQSIWGLVTTIDSTGTTTVYASHDGRGAERPGVSVINPATNTITATHKFDQLPSNTVTALASDWWGVHIATDIGPLTHWNQASGDFEIGVEFQQALHPLHTMVSNGDKVIVLGGQNSAMLVEARTSAHKLLTTFRPSNIVDATLGASHIWVTTENGLRGWYDNRQYNPVQETSMRRALPMTLRALNNGAGINVSTMVHPGMNIQLVSPSDPFALDANMGTAGVHNILFQNVPLVITSPVTGAAVWAKSVSMNYDVTLDLSSDPSLLLNLQNAVDNGLLYNNTRHVALRLYSPSNGSLEVRLTYDYIRTDTPVSMENLVDRPDDGGGVLTASWSLVHDDDFARYLIFLHEGPWASPPTELTLLGQSPDKAISLHSRLSSDVDTAEGEPLKNGTAYYAVVVVEYNDGRWGKISLPMGPATPTDEIPVAPAWAIASAMGVDGEDGDIELEWARCTALDLAKTNIYVATTPMTDALGRVPFTSALPNEGNQTILSLNPGIPVWIGLTCVDVSGQENLSDVTVVGPIVPTGELNDNTPPAPIEATIASDVPDDEGGRILVTWNGSKDIDCAFYTVFASKANDLGLTGLDSNWSMVGTVDGFSQATIINSCSTTDVIITSLDGIPLVDGQSYVFGIVAYDTWLNANTDEVLLVSATPFQNVVGAGLTPPRITSILAFDHPNDLGHAIDVVWEPSTVDDFASYTVWASNFPVTDLSLAVASFGTNPSLCGCFSFNKQWIDEKTNPIELTISNALYVPDGGRLSDGVPGMIQQDIKLHVAVTVHDLKGNVYLTNLTEATVTPLNNLNDVTAPDRLTDLRLTDRPNDDGSGLLLDFTLSDAPDIATYEVYAAAYDFGGDVSTNQGQQNAIEPVAILRRNPTLPLTIDLVAGDIPVVAGQEIWVAVVARDSSGNAHETLLTMVSAVSIDQGITDVGIYLPDIKGLSVAWFEDVNIFVEWQHSTDARVKGYHIYISDSIFTSTDDATKVGETVSANSLLITPQMFKPLTNTSAWFIAVVPYDDAVAKSTVNAVKLNPLDSSGNGNQQDDGNNQLTLDTLLTTPNLIAFGMLLIIMLLLILVVRSRGEQSQRSKRWELQEATWGIQDSSWDMPPLAMAPPVRGMSGSELSAQDSADIYAAANQIRSESTGRTAYQGQQPVLRPQQQSSAFDELMNDAQPTPKMPQIDTSFLDDLL